MKKFFEALDIRIKTCDLFSSHYKLVIHFIDICLDLLSSNFSRFSVKLNRSFFRHQSNEYLPVKKYLRKVNPKICGELAAESSCEAAWFTRRKLNGIPVCITHILISQYAVHRRR